MGGYIGAFILRGWENIRGSAYIFCEKPLISLLSVEKVTHIGIPRDVEIRVNTFWGWVHLCTHN